MNIRFLLVILLFISPCVLPATANARAPVKVGIYQNSPGVFTDTDGKVRGFYIDIFEYVAQKEQWTFQYVAGSWNEGLERLAHGQIDLLPAIAHSDDRAKRYDFSQEIALSNWGQVYILDTNIQSILDLRDKTIGGLKNDIYTLGLQSLLTRLNLQHSLSPTNEYATVLQWVAEGRIDAGIVSRTFGLKHEHNHAINRSTIICCPVGIRYATQKGHNGDLLRMMDKHLKKLKQDKKSLYYDSMTQWFGSMNKERFPLWIKWALSITGTLLLLFLAGTIILRREVQSKTVALQNEVLEHKRVDKQLKESHQKLLITATELEKKAEALEKAKLEAETANRLKGELFANLGHEIFTPMNTILGLADLTTREHSTDKIRAFSIQIHKAANALTERIKNFISLSQLITERIVLDPLPFVVGDFVGILVELHREKVLAKRLRLRVHIREDLPLLLQGDPEKLGQVMGNLLDNAIKFTEKGEIILELGLESQSQEHLHLRCSIKDTGIGLATEQQEKIFTAFYQVDGSSTRKYGGNGIGLAVCKRIIEKMGGRIWVESTLSKGSTFHFTVRLQTLPETGKEQPTTPLSWLVEPQQKRDTGQISDPQRFGERKAAVKETTLFEQ